MYERASRLDYSACMVEVNQKGLKLMFCCVAFLSPIIVRGLNFSAGRRSSCFQESISIPRNVRTVVGPTTLSGATENPRRSQRGSAVSNAAPHVGDPAWPQKKKSSR